MMQEIDGIPVYMLILIVIVLLAQGTWLFLDARKREANAWFWGICGCIQTPMPLIFYWIVVRRKRKANFTKV